MDLQNKKIDIVVPVYNGEKYILDAINSIVNQSLKPNKIIVVDDGSTDGTFEIVSNYSKESSVHINIIKQKNGGISAARNTGIKNSNADFVAFLDHDDIWLMDKLYLQMEVFKNSNIENLGLVYCMFEQINANGNTIPNKINLKNIETNKGSNLLKKNLDKNIVMSSGSGVLIKKECFEKIGMFDESLSAFEDWDMWLRIIKQYGIDYVDKTLVGIRTHNTNMQKNYKHMLSNQIKFYKKWFWIALFKKPQVIPLWSYRLLKSIKSYFLSIKKIKEKKVSVIMPVYNGEKYIAETLESLVCQSEYIKELIIINDNSTDNTVAIIEKFKDEKDKSNIIILTNNKFEKGISGSLNTGIEISTGTYLARADSDDVYTYDRIHQQVKFLNTHKKIDIVGSSFIIFGDNIKRKKIYRPFFSVLTSFLMIRDTSICHPSVMFRRSVLQTIPKYPNVTVEDFAFFSKALKKHRAVNTLKSFIYYRKHNNNYSLNFVEKKPDSRSTQETFRKNYLYYTKSIENIDLFSFFLKNRKINLTNFLTIFKVSNHILKKIKQDYKIKFYSLDFLCSVFWVYVLILFCTIRRK